MEEKDLESLLDAATAKAYAFMNDGHLGAAEAVAKQALRVRRSPSLLRCIGVVYHRLGRHEEGGEALAESLAGEEHPDARNALALCLSAQRRTSEAIAHLERAVAAAPGVHHYRANLGLQYGSAGRWGDAAKLLAGAAEACPSDPVLWLNLGGAYGNAKDIRAAISCFSRALSIDPGNHAAHVDLAYSRLLLGEWDEAWPHYEHRLDYFPQVQYFREAYDWGRRWAGENLSGKTLVVWCEQGAGDMINFIRLAKLTGAGKTVVHTSEALRPLLVCNLPCEVVSGPPDEYDYHCSVMSLPYLVGVGRCDGRPYLGAPSRMSLPGGDFKVGVAWAGNPMHPSDASRSCRLSLFRAVHDILGVRLFSLQKDTRKRAYSNSPDPVDLAEGCEGMQVVDLSGGMHTFADTASAVSAMDAVVCVDTAVLHLSGALGKRTVALIAKNPDWRWGLSGRETRWYDSVTLSRQGEDGEWEPAFREAASIVRDWVRSG